MSKDKSPASGGVVGLGSTCCVDKCGKKGDRLNFCPEHYGWFKEGLINKKGQKPSDFDKKYQDFLMRQKAA